MSEEKIEVIMKKQRKINWAKLAAIFAGIMVIINLILLTNFRIALPSFRKAAYFGSIVESPVKFEILPLIVSPIYFTELIIRGPKSIVYKDKIKFSLTVKEKGKNNIKKPEIRIFVIDSIGCVRGIYPSEILLNGKLYETEDNIEKEDIKKNIKFSFDMPPEDQKVLGTWRIFTYLYDDKDLASYIVYEFDVTEKERLALLSIILTFVTVAMGSIAVMSSLIILKSFLKSSSKREKK